MLTKLLKSFLSIVENPRSLPNFLFVYSLIWLLWHYQFLLSFGTLTGGVIERFSKAIDGVDEFHYISVFFVTTILFVLYFGFQVLVKQSREYVDKIDRKEKFPLNALVKSNDMEQLVLTLEVLQKELETSKASEKAAKLEVKKAIAELMIVQTKLDETNADLEILKASKQIAV
jgi:hypothetical protein